MILDNYALLELYISKKKKLNNISNHYVFYTLRLEDLIIIIVSQYL